MNKGIVIFAHNSAELDYSLLALISGGLAKKHLKLPVCLITDIYTKEYLKNTYDNSLIEKVFDHIIEITLPKIDNSRKLYNGSHSKKIPFINSTRPNVWYHTPFDHTLLIDSDYLIFSDIMNQYWEVDSSVLISRGINDIVGNRLQILDKRIAERSSKLFWATTVMFKKNEESQIFFDTVDFIRSNYRYFGDIFGIDIGQYRNDISFSIARHILSGFEEDEKHTLPKILTVYDRDILHKVSSDGNLVFLLDEKLDGRNFIATSLKNTDVHIMNKQAINFHKDTFLEML